MYMKGLVSFHIRPDTRPFPTMHQHCNGGYGGKPGMIHVRSQSFNFPFAPYYFSAVK
jgi:hypothetical protein